MKQKTMAHYKTYARLSDRVKACKKETLTQRPLTTQLTLFNLNI